MDRRQEGMGRAASRMAEGVGEGVREQLTETAAAKGGSPMERSDDRILTTHTGSLPRPDALRELFIRRQAGASVDDAEREALEKAGVRESIAKQAAAGIDVGND